MINLNSLMAITESGGYYGGACYDMMPGITLDEAVDLLPLELNEMHADLSASRIKYNDMLVEAAMNGSVSSVNYIVEMSFEDIKKKIKSIFKKIIDFLKSIIAKIGVEINKIRLTGNELWSKYRQSDYINNKTFKGLEIEGYPNIITEANPLKKVESFASKDAMVGLIKKVSKSDRDYTDIGQLFKSMFDDTDNQRFTKERMVTTGAAGAGVTRDSPADKAMEKAIKQLTDITKEDESLMLAKEMTGFNDLGKEWQNGIIKKIYGTKGPIKYGDKGFSVSGLEPVLKDPKDLDEVRHCYSMVLKSAQDFESDIQRSIDDLPTGRSGDLGQYDSRLNSWYTAYMGLVTNSYDVINTLQSINYKYQQTRLKQAKAMFVKMMNYKEEKKNNSSAYDLYYDSIDVMDFDF